MRADSTEIYWEESRNPLIVEFPKNDLFNRTFQRFRKESLMERKFPVKKFGNFDIPRKVVFFSRNSGKCCSSPYRMLRSAHTMRPVPATSPCNKSRGQVPSCELAIFASKSSRSSTISNQFESFWTSPCDLFLKTLLVSCSWNKSLRPVPSC